MQGGYLVRDVRIWLVTTYEDAKYWIKYQAHRWSTPLLVIGVFFWGVVLGATGVCSP